MGISTTANMETEDCVAITPSGELIMSLQRETLERLEGNFSISVRSPKGDKSVIKIDLKSANAKTQIKNTTLAVDLTLRWIPPGNEYSNGKVSACSIAKYLREHCQLLVENVPAGCRKIVRTDEPVPRMNSANLFAEDRRQTLGTHDELLEYIGMIALDCQTKPTEYLSSYRLDDADRDTETMSIFHGHGMITTDEIERLILRVTTLLSESMTIPWVGLHVQGFSNLPLSSAIRGDCGIYSNYDRGYTMIITNLNLLFSKCFGCHM
ncbi:ribonuclease P protein subunit p40-like [Anopheles stephensi]|uniref:ribonuclease P protein subunit p40-like n=1 Tax=Anopheles stephensi TaxID=30069 RepID=UPI0016587AB5|nr:ribonuclease P protein subunit p40-like [Anopheles stephensi]